MNFSKMALVLLLGTVGVAQNPKLAAVSAGVLSVADTQRLMPPSVFFQGQVASVQMRNSFGVRFKGGGLVLAGVVDTGGYSSAVQQKYQFYLLSDTGFELNGKRFTPGSYGCGFWEKNILVMDLGGNEVYRSPVAHDDAMTRPRPLQIVAGKATDEYRLYLGRDYVTLRP
jgi:hypothetical protein